MDLSIFLQKDFPSYVSQRLSVTPIDYKEKYYDIKTADKSGSKRQAAGVVLLLHYNGSEYVFQLIKRSNRVSQAGDISCPGGMLHRKIDKIISFLLGERIIATRPYNPLTLSSQMDKETAKLIHLFLVNSLREAWEEIGLNPFNTIFLGALPCYSLSLFARTIFPLVCTVPHSYKFILSREVEKILEIPVSAFFDSSNHALLELETPFHNSNNGSGNNYFPCFIFSDGRENAEIIWGATFNIIINFLNIISDNSFYLPSTNKIIKKVLTSTYITGSH